MKNKNCTERAGRGFARRLLASIPISAALFLSMPAKGYESNWYYFEIQEERWFIDAGLGSLFSFNHEDFAVQGPWKQEKLSQDISLAAELKAGASLEADRVVYDISAAGGMMWNDAFSLPWAGADAVALFKVNESTGVGPHLQLLYAFGGDWKGDADIKLSGSPGAGAGLAMTVAPESSSWSIKLSVDYLYLKVGSKESDYWRAADDLDLSGVFCRLAFLYRFGEPLSPAISWY